MLELKHNKIKNYKYIKLIFLLILLEILYSSFLRFNFLPFPYNNTKFTWISSFINGTKPGDNITVNDKGYIGVNIVRTLLTLLLFLLTDIKFNDENIISLYIRKLSLLAVYFFPNEGNLSYLHWPFAAVFIVFTVYYYTKNINITGLEIYLFLEVLILKILLIRFFASKINKKISLSENVAINLEWAILIWIILLELKRLDYNQSDLHFIYDYIKNKINFNNFLTI